MQRQGAKLGSNRACLFAGCCLFHGLSVVSFLFLFFLSLSLNMYVFCIIAIKWWSVWMICVMIHYIYHSFIYRPPCELHLIFRWIISEWIGHCESEKTKSKIRKNEKLRDKNEFSWNLVYFDEKYLLSNSLPYNRNKSDNAAPVPTGMSILPPYCVGKHSTLKCFCNDFMSLPWKWICVHKKGKKWHKKLNKMWSTRKPAFGSYI